MKDIDYVQLADMKTCSPNCLLPIDIASMQHGLEVRPALPDINVFDFILSILPQCIFNNKYSGKAVLKKILIDFWVGEIFDFRKKLGFSIS